jgi:hypothetical protein
MRTLILNSGNIVEGTNNSQLQYNFAGGNINLKPGQKVALANLQMYYSTFNITSANRNNTYSYIWVDGVTYTVTMPNGFYDIDAINNYLHYTMVQNKHYLETSSETSSGDFVYLATWSVNATRYSVELNCFGISVAVAAANTWTLPVGATWVLPTNFIVPEIVIPNTNFSLVVGFSAGTYPNAVIAGVPPAQTQLPAYTTDQQFLSTFTPQVTPLSSYILTCSLINNDYAVPNSLMYSFSPQGTVGEQFTIAPNEYMWIDCLPGQYAYFTVTFIDQDFRPVVIEDPNMIIQIVISDPADHMMLK